MGKILTFLIFILSAILSYVHTQVIGFDKVNLNSKENPCQTIVLNHARDNDDTGENARSDEDSKRANHLTVRSTTGYQVKVQSGNSMGNKTIAPKMSISEEKKLLKDSGKNNALGKNAEILISKTAGSQDKKINLPDTAKDDDNSTIYATEVIYTIEAI